MEALQTNLPWNGELLVLHSAFPGPDPNVDAVDGDAVLGVVTWDLDVAWR